MNYNELPINSAEKIESEKIIQKLGLRTGKKIKIILRTASYANRNAVGREIDGTLNNDIQIGFPIPIDFGDKSNIRNIQEKNRTYFIQTLASTYELISDESKNKNIQTFTMQDLEKEIKIYNSKGYNQFDLFNDKVPAKDNPYILFMTKNGFKDGDKVIFYSDEKERTGTIVDDGKRGFSIIDSKGNKKGIGFLGNDLNNYIRKA